jgi:abhydrolase domain-containing protein 5
MLHGYGGSGALFYKTLKGLSEHFYVICIDIVGMGASCRPTFKPANNADGDLFFVQVFEKWRIAMGNITQFYLLGHSFGGYLSGVYASAFPQHIKKLLLVSPLGIKKRPPGTAPDMDRWNNRNPPPKWAQVLKYVAWSSKTSPFSAGRLLGPTVAKSGVERYVNRM